NPHPRSQTLAADVAQREHRVAVVLLDAEEVTGHVSGRKRFARNLKVAVAHEVWSAQPTIHLRSLKEPSVQISIVLPELSQFELKLLLASLLARYRFGQPRRYHIQRTCPREAAAEQRLSHSRSLIQQTCSRCHAPLKTNEDLPDWPPAFAEGEGCEYPQCECLGSCRSPTPHPAVARG